ncbi:MAG: nitrite/sulfite reductase [Acidimicrobiales bacterium]|nr:ferredoxin--nitrite reductase [Acidimicrobiaceae bacterium]MCS5680650.1 nitrite/sulfite reductase [Acidimicrobiales bacterium]MEC9203671.1 nitrite/sulfite reductase [Actinomycetota bacterium]MEE3210802.1 nitrite/sulfite reductase [Actinomycetota bacterium]
MAQLTSPLETAPIDPEMAADIDKFEEQLAGYFAGRVPEDVFRVFRLNNGIYGQRQGGTNQMVRVKVPYGAMTADQLDALADLVVDHSRGWGHITTRQNIQFHFVELAEIPRVMRRLASVGLTTREACGDTVRNVQGCHLAGACPFEVLDISAWSEAAYRHFVRNPISQRLPRKFKINFSGCDTDCGQAMFNDVGVIAASRTHPDGSVEQGFRVYIAGGLGTTPFPALALEEFTSRGDLLPTIESVLRVFDQTGNRDNKLRARLKWVVDQLGIDEVRRRVVATRKFLPASSTWPGGVPEVVAEWGDDPAGLAAGTTPTPIGQGVPVSLGAKTPFDQWVEANVVRGAANGTVSAYAWCELGDVTADQFRAVAAIVREFDTDVRVTNRQNFVLRDLTEDQLPALFQHLVDAGMAKPGAELLRDVVACPGADTCNLAVTQSRGLAKAIGEALEAEGLAEVGGVRINISGCTNSCGQHHTSDIGFFGAERRAHGQSAPGYQMLLGGYVGQEQVHFGQKALRLPAHNAPQATVQVVRRFVDERQAGENFPTWLERSGGAKEVAIGLKELDQFPLPDESPDFYVDFDETGPYSAEVGDSECAT